jgi:hypothetical protein
MEELLAGRTQAGPPEICVRLKEDCCYVEIKTGIKNMR